MPERVQPFGDLGDFTTRESGVRPDPKVVDAIAESSNFPSRAVKRGGDGASIVRPVRRFTTGRNRQINIKATDQTIALFHSLADEMNVPLGAVLEHALNALRDERGG
jgi:hypothetical protein